MMDLWSSYVSDSEGECLDDKTKFRIDPKV